MLLIWEYFSNADERDDHADFLTYFEAPKLLDGRM